MHVAKAAVFIAEWHKRTFSQIISNITNCTGHRKTMVNLKSSNVMSIS